MALSLNAAMAQDSPSALNGSGSKLQRALVMAWQALNEDCRGGHGDDSATGVRPQNGYFQSTPFARMPIPHGRLLDLRGKQTLNCIKLGLSHPTFARWRSISSSTLNGFLLF